MFKPEKQEAREVSPHNLTEAERRIVDSLTPEDIELVRKLSTNNLTKERRKIVGARTEDIFSLLESVHKGFLPVELETDRDEYFVEANPESTFLNQNKPEALEKNESKGFGDFRYVANLNTPSAAVKHAVELNLLSHKGARERLVKELRDFYRDQEFDSDEFNLKEFYRDVAYDLTINPDVLQFNSRSRPALSLLARAVQNALSPDEARNFLQSLTARKGVLLAFNEELLRKYRFLKSGHHGVMVLEVPSGKVDLDTVLGFETLGDFEDSVLEKIAASEAKLP
jgi:hypothetical protein